MSYYELLGVSKSATNADIKKAFRKLALKYHPDKCNSKDDTFQKIHEAYKVLSDPSRRMTYDLSLGANEHEINKMFDDLLGNMMDSLLKRCCMKRQKPVHDKEKHNTNTAADSRMVKPLIARIKVTLDDIYNMELKKVVMRVRRDETWKRMNFYVNLLEHKDEYIYKEAGDHEYGEKGHVIIKVERLAHDYIKRDKIISDYDLFIEEDISLYEYLYGFEKRIEYLGGDVLTIRCSNPQEYSNKYGGYMYTHVLEGYGLPYLDETETVVYGNLYLHFKLVLPEKPPEDPEMKENIKTYFKIYTK